MKFKGWSFIAIILLACGLRLYGLGQYPVSLNLDEVAIGYNAYSILKTGMDEYGTRLPLAFRSHDDYKAPLYIYATTIPIAIFGLTPFSVRLVSVIFGVIGVIFTYFLVEELVKNKKQYAWLPLLTTLLLAISPWHLQYSRVAFEVNMATTLIIIGVWAFLKGLKQPKFWWISAVSLALSVYAYHSSKLFVPLMAVVFGWVARKKILSYKYYVISGLLLFGLIVSPLIPFSLTPEGQLRFKGTSVFNTPTLVDLNHDLKIEQWRAGREYQAKLFHNELFVGLQVFLRGYFSHFTYDLLFFGEYGPPKNQTPNVGLLYLWELPFVIIGLYALAQKKIKYRLLIICWFLLAPVASGLTWDFPNTTRITIQLPTWQIITGLGVITLYHWLHQRWRWLYLGFLGVNLVFFFSLYLHNYYRIAPALYSSAWQDGYREAVRYAEQHLDQVDKVIVSTNLKQPQNFFAFYSQYDPNTYIHVDGGTKSGGFLETGNTFGKYYFRPISWQPNELETNTMYIDYLSGHNENYDFDTIITSVDKETVIGIYIHDVTKLQKDNQSEE